MKRVLVTGANGQLGLALQGATKDSNLAFVFVDKNTLDITNTEAIKEVFATQSFDVCINAAAYTDVDGAETNKALAYAINATAVETLAKACKQHRCWLIHISTDYVFDGALDRPYTPSDTPTLTHHSPRPHPPPDHTTHEFSFCMEMSLFLFCSGLICP